MQLRRELKLREVMLARALDDLSRAERARQLFFTGASHDLRTPLNAIICYGDLLAGSLLGELNERQREAAERVCLAGRQLSELIDGVLELSRLQSGRTEPRLSATELVSLAKPVIDSLAADAHQREIRVRLEAPDREVTAETDAVLVRRILLNLCMNALKLPDTRDVRVRVRETSAGARIDVLRVGSDLPAAEEAVSFEALSSAGRPQAGTGLDLAMAGEAAVQLGGRVTVKSRRGRGSVFTLHLPARAPQLLPV